MFDNDDFVVAMNSPNDEMEVIVAVLNTAIQIAKFQGWNIISAFLNARTDPA